MPTQKQKTENTLSLYKDLILHTAKNDFDKLPISQQERIVGRKTPKQLANYGVKDSTIDKDHPDYLQFLLEGRAKWLEMQTLEILKQIIKDETETND
jgi:hypothetical protein